MTTPFPLGAYLGNPDGDSPAAEAEFQSLYTSFSATLGAHPTFIDAYIDQTQPISQWIGNAQWQSWSNQQSSIAKNMIPVIGLPMTSTAPGHDSPDQYYKDFAAGKYDAVIQGVIKTWADHGFTTQYWRPGWEMNLTSMPNYAGNDAATQADWVKAFQHIADVMHQTAHADGVTLKVIWNPSVTNYSNAEATKALYPGNQYVDIIGADVYADLNVYGTKTALYDWSKSGSTFSAASPVFSSLKQWASDPANLTHYYTYPAATQWSLDGSGGHSLSLQNLIDFAKAQGKPLGIAETGAGSTNDGAGLSDNPTFVKWLSDTLTSAGIPISFVNIWDNNGGGNMEFSAAGDNKPLEATAWAKYFGNAGGLAVQAPVAPPVLTLGTGSDQVVLHLSEDAFLGDAQAGFSVDGVQVGSTQTIVAAHASGQEQTVTLNGTWGTGQHTVAVKFLNDVWVQGVGDRNLYVDGASYDGAAAAGTLALAKTGSQSLTVGSVSPLVIVGSGPDTLDLQMSEDAYQGDSKFTVSVDGVQVGGTLTAQGHHTGGTDQDFRLEGSWGAGRHTVAVDFLNDLYSSTTGGDRNLYLDGASYDGASMAYAKLNLTHTGTQTFQTGLPDTLTLQVAEDAWQGNAQFTVSVDGVQAGGTYTATASHAAGASQELDIGGAWGTGTHTVAVNFLNDAYGGTTAADRNLYVTGVAYDGAAQVGATLTLKKDGAQSVQATSSTTYTEGTAGGSITTLGNDTVRLGTGTVSITDRGPSLIVTGGAGRMTFLGGTGAATITGGAGTIAITGGAGSLTFTVGSGQATVAAGSGAEVFDIVAGHAGGLLAITGFSSSHDMLHLTGYAGTGIRSEQIIGGTTSIVLTDNTRITLTGFAMDNAHGVFG